MERQTPPVRGPPLDHHIELEPKRLSNDERAQDQYILVQSCLYNSFHEIKGLIFLELIRYSMLSATNADVDLRGMPGRANDTRRMWDDHES